MFDYTLPVEKYSRATAIIREIIAVRNLLKLGDVDVTQSCVGHLSTIKMDPAFMISLGSLKQRIPGLGRLLAKEYGWAEPLGSSALEKLNVLAVMLIIGGIDSFDEFLVAVESRYSDDATLEHMDVDHFKKAITEVMTSTLGAAGVDTSIVTFLPLISQI